MQFNVLSIFLTCLHYYSGSMHEILYLSPKLFCPHLPYYTPLLRQIFCTTVQGLIVQLVEFETER